MSMENQGAMAIDLTDKHVSTKLRFMSFFAAMLVVAQHSYMQVTFFQTCVTQSATRIAVPFFFVVSGVLLYKDFDLSFEWAWDKIASRCKTLLLPYFTWSILLILLGGGWWRAINSINGCLTAFGITSSAPYMAGHLWYVRLLFLFVIFAVPLAVSLKFVRWLIPILAIIGYAVFMRSANWSSLCWFSIGALIALTCPDVINKRLKGRTVAMLLGVGLFLIFFRTLVFKGVMSMPIPLPMFTRITEVLLVLVVVPAIWCGYNFISHFRVVPALIYFAPASFFLYCAHPYVYHLFPCSIHWAFRISFNIVICICAYMLLKKMCPKALLFISGGR